MNPSPLLRASYPRAVLHIDGDAFFASCEQARNPALKGKPVITGLERGIASSMSYEAKAMGITRAMPLHEIRARAPQAIILPSDYETYSLLSHRFYDIVRRWTPDVEEYGIDECFADITGLRRLHHATYPQIAANIQEALRAELGFTFSIGLAPTKTLAKLGSKWKKPYGRTAIAGHQIHTYLERLPVENVWGIGPQTTAMLAKYNITTALQFARQPLEWIFSHTHKPLQEIWQELNGVSVLALSTEPTIAQASIQKFKTFTPPTTDTNFLLAQLSRNIENACIKARRHKLAAREVLFVLRTQHFQHAVMEVRLSQPTSLPGPLITAAIAALKELQRPGTLYRATGVVCSHLVTDADPQPDLFGSHIVRERMRRVFASADALDEKYGKHTIAMASSHGAHRHAQHEGERGNTPVRMTDLFRGETKRQRLAIPMLMGAELVDQMA